MDLQLLKYFVFWYPFIRLWDILFYQTLFITFVLNFEDIQFFDVSRLCLSIEPFLLNTVFIISQFFELHSSHD